MLHLLREQYPTLPPPRMPSNCRNYLRVSSVFQINWTTHESSLRGMIIRKNKGMIINPSHPIRSLNQPIRIRPDMLHCIASRCRLKQLNGRISSDELRIQRLACRRIKRGTVIDEKNTQNIGVWISSHVEAMEIERPISIDSGEAGSCDPFDSVFDSAGASSIENDQTIE
jgi:hypothetical protein